jgi:hypothetical protein
MKKLLWFLFGIAGGFVLAHFMDKDPRGHAVLEQVDARIAEFTDRMSDAYREQEAHFSGAFEAVRDAASDAAHHASDAATDTARAVASGVKDAATNVADKAASVVGAAADVAHDAADAASDASDSPAS